MIYQRYRSNTRLWNSPQSPSRWGDYRL